MADAGASASEQVGSSCRPKNQQAPVAILEGLDDSHQTDDEPPCVLNVDPKENLKLHPKKSILKTTSSFDNQRKLSLREAHFDEMNILATFHPADKDYGHMKVDEPKTPFHHHSDSESEEGTSEGVRRVSLSEPPSELDPKTLEEKIMKTIQKHPRSESMEAEDDSDEEETEERAAKRRAFEMKRKQHYNEFQAVKLAKQLIKEDEKELSTDESCSKT